MVEEIGKVDIDDELTSFTWTLDYVNCHNKKVDESIWSPNFLTPDQYNKSTEWRLQLYPNGVNRKSRGYLSLYLRPLEEKKSSFFQRAVYFSILNVDDIEVNRVNVEIFSVLSRDSWGVDKFMETSLLTKQADILLKAGKLTIYCCIANIKTLKKLNNPSSITPPIITTPKPVPRTRSLENILHSDSDSEFDDNKSDKSEKLPIEDFEFFLEKGKSDVKLITKDKIFHVHRVILSSSSPVFKSTFEKDTKNNSVIDMSDIESEIVKEIMRFIYLGNVTNLESIAKDLLAPASKYKLEVLKSMCIDVMITNLNVYNASEYLVLSFINDADELQTRAMEFVVHNSENVMNTPGFELMAGSHANVIAALFRTLKFKKSNF